MIVRLKTLSELIKHYCLPATELQKEWIFRLYIYMGNLVSSMEALDIWNVLFYL